MVELTLGRKHGGGLQSWYATFWVRGFRNWGFTMDSLHGTSGGNTPFLRTEKDSMHVAGGMYHVPSVSVYLGVHALRTGSSRWLVLNTHFVAN